MQAKDIMTRRLITIKPDTSIGDAIDVLLQHKISGLVVLDNADQIFGIVSEKDILIAYDFLNNLEDPVSDFISKDVISVSEETPVEEISRILVQYNIKRVPVLQGKQVLGIISRYDVLNAIRSAGK